MFFILMHVKNGHIVEQNSFDEATMKLEMPLQNHQELLQWDPTRLNVPCTLEDIYRPLRKRRRVQEKNS